MLPATVAGITCNKKNSGRGAEIFTVSRQARGGYINRRGESDTVSRQALGGSLSQHRFG